MWRKIENVENYNGPATSQMIINTEWGALGDNGSLEFIRTSYDKEIDNHSINRGKQIYEKMISGMYMGEIVRLALHRFTKLALLFNGEVSEQLKTRGKFPTDFVSEIELDEVGNYTRCMQVLQKLGITNATTTDCANVRYICECVSKRSAHLVSAGIATLINKMGESTVTVGVDGSVYRHHPHYHDIMMHRIGQFVDAKFDLMLSEDGSGRGAALVAAVACREEGRI
jgi:hexokinase